MLKLMMNPVFVFPSIIMIMTAMVWTLKNIVLRTTPDLEVENLKRSRQIDVPEECIAIPLYKLSLCINCEMVHSHKICPICGSSVDVPLTRMVGSIFEKPGLRSIGINSHSPAEQVSEVPIDLDNVIYLEERAQ